MVLMAMNRDFFIRLTIAAYRVADKLPEPEVKTYIQESTNKALADLIVFTEGNPITAEQRKSAAARAIKEVGTLVAYFGYAKRMHWVNPNNFSILEREYMKVGEFLKASHQQAMEQETPISQVQPEAPIQLGSVTQDKGISERQKRILEIIRGKDKTQVWELQKVLPEVTKRTLRRDLDDMMNKNLIERKGEWNAVFYQLIIVD